MPARCQSAARSSWISETAHDQCRDRIEWQIGVFLWDNPLFCSETPLLHMCEHRSVLCMQGANQTYAGGMQFSQQAHAYAQNQHLAMAVAQAAKVRNPRTSRGRRQILPLSPFFPFHHT